MTTKILTGTYAAGYSLQSIYSTLQITRSALVEGQGVTARGQATIVNRGLLQASGTYGLAASCGISLRAGGQVSNYATIVGAIGAVGTYKNLNGGYNGGDGTYFKKQGDVVNHQSIRGGGGGAGANGAKGEGAAGRGGWGANAIDLRAGGTVANKGELAGGAGGEGGYGYGSGAGGIGGGAVAFGSTGTLINSGGVILGGVGGTGGIGGAGGAGVSAGARLEIINKAVIAGGAGGDGHPAEYIRDGARGAYGGNGGSGLRVLFAGGSVANSGSIMGGKGGAGAQPGGAGGYGGGGLYFAGAATIANSGLILGGAGGAGGVSMTRPGGSGGRGGQGVLLQRGGPMINAGTVGGGAGGAGGAGYDGYGGGIGGSGGRGAEFYSSARSLNRGLISGGAGGDGGTSDYIGGRGGFGADGVDMSGLLTNTGTVLGGAGGDGGATIGGGAVTGGVGAAGGMGLAGGFGTVVNVGAIAGGRGGAGGSAAGGGQGGSGGAGALGVELLSGPDVLVNRGLVSGGAGGVGGNAQSGDGTGGQGGNGVEAFAQCTVLNSGIISGGAGGSGANGGLSGIGVLFAGSGRLSNKQGGLITGQIGVDAHYDPAVTVTNAGSIQGVSYSVRFGSASDVLVAKSGGQFTGAILGGGGTLALDGGNGDISGLGGAGMLTGTDLGSFSGFGTYRIEAGSWTVVGEGFLALGQKLVDSGSLVITPEGNTFANAGLVASRGAGNLQVAGAIRNAGRLETRGGTLVVDGDVSGGGLAVIAGGLLDFSAGFNERVRFLQPAGTLELANSEAYSASVFNFSTTGATALDLKDIGFVSADGATFSGTSTRGVLTVSDGTHTAHIKLVGDFTTATFVASSDGKGGTIVVAESQGALGQVRAFASAIAGLAPTHTSIEPPTRQSWHDVPPTLATARGQLA